MLASCAQGAPTCALLLDSTTLQGNSASGGAGGALFASNNSAVLVQNCSGVVAATAAAQDAPQPGATGATSLATLLHSSSGGDAALGQAHKQCQVTLANNSASGSDAYGSSVAGAAAALASNVSDAGRPLAQWACCAVHTPHSDDAQHALLGLSSLCQPASCWCATVRMYHISAAHAASAAARLLLPR